MRISDWSSDLCSSDLPGAARERIQPGDDSTVSRRPPKPDPRPDPRSGPRPDPRPDPRIEIREKTTAFKGYFQVDRYRLRHRKFDGDWTAEMTREVFERGHAAAVLLYDRSEEHTSELQSLMRISYAVFCLKKKKTEKNTETA